MVLTAYFRCPWCNQTREYVSDDLSPIGWSSCEEMEFNCKACGRDLKLEIDYEFAFFEQLPYAEDDYFDYDDILRYTIKEAREQYEKEHKPSRFSLKSGFSLGPAATRFSLPSGVFSLGNRKSHGKSLLKLNFKRGEK